MACRCSRSVDGGIKSHGAALAAVAMLLAAGCTTTPAIQAQVSPSTKAAVHTFGGGCSGTVLTDAIPPLWAQGGWTNPGAQPWSVPWAYGTPDTALAYVFATQLVAGPSPRVDGSNNKVLWEAKDLPSGGGVLVEGRPLGQSQPVVTIAGGPSIVDVPTAGCWTFQLSWSANGKRSSSIINLEVLRAGTNPMLVPSIVS
jgi:hypothetical protein